jgi:hypothetical protein
MQQPAGARLADLSSMTHGAVVAFREACPERADEFVARGHRLRRFFPHRVHVLPKCGPDHYKLARAMGVCDHPDAMRHLLLYADDSLLDEFPRELFFDDDLNWHRLQLGRPGLVAGASLVLDGRTLHCLTYVSDLVQRIGLRREHKTRIEKVFEGWRQMLLNAVLHYAIEQEVTEVRSATSVLAMRHTDPARRDGLGPEMYERIYDRTVTGRYPARREGDWWVLETRAVADRVVPLQRRAETRAPERTICVCHDVERGLGHVDHEPEFVEVADRASPAHLRRMLEIEAEAGAATTYAVVGSLLDDVAGDLAAGGHALAFHSWDHRFGRDGQLARCRSADYRIKGYRPPRSRLTAELSAENLLFHNFEWLASGSGSLGWARRPILLSGLVRIPIHTDDFPMHSGALSYEEWEEGIVAAAAESSGFLAIGTHDCYAEHWLAGYPRLLERLGGLGNLRTLDQVAAEVALASGA